MSIENAPESTQLPAPVSQGEPCPMAQFVNLVSGKWAIPILYRLMVFDAPVRFSNLQRAVAPITQKELTRQLRLFEHRNLVQRTVYAEVPPRVEYSLTEFGRTLEPILMDLKYWGDGYKELLVNMREEQSA